MADSARLDELQRKYAENPRRYFAPLANEYRKAGELSTAVAICREELARFPGHMSGHVVLGQALYESRRPTEAQAAFERALALDPENLIALRHLGDIARDRGDLREARSWYERVLEADPRNDDIAAQLSRLAPSYGRPTQAPAYVPHPTPPVPPAAPRAAEPLLEPLEWTALDLGIPGQAAPGDAAADPQTDAPRPDAATSPIDGLLDVEPTELLLSVPDADRATPAELDDRDVSGSFSVISDEVSAIADDHGLVDVVDARERQDRAADADVSPAVADEARVDESSPPIPEQAFVIEAPQAGSAVLWDDLLPSLDVDSEETAAADAVGAQRVAPEAERESVASADLEKQAAENTAVEEPVVAAEPGPATELLSELAPEPHSFESSDPVPESVEIEPVEVEPVEAAPAPEAPEAALADDAGQLRVESAHDVELTSLQQAAPAEERPSDFQRDARVDEPAPVGTVEFSGSSAESSAEPAAADELLFDDVAFELPVIDADARTDHAEPSAPAPAAAPTSEPLAIDDAVDVYDFLVPFEEPEAAAAELEVLAPDATDEAAPEAGEQELSVEQPSFAALFPDVAEDGPVVDALHATSFMVPSVPAYDPVVGLDVPPAPPVPPVLAAAVNDLDAEDAGSPTPAGAFVTETMAQLLSQQGHLEQALEVYAQLRANRPDDEALRERVDALRARVAPPMEAAEPAHDAPPADVGSTTAAAFFASLALDESIVSGETHADEAEPWPSGPSDDVVASDSPAVVEHETPIIASTPSIGFFDAPAGPLDEGAAARLAQAFGTHADVPSSLISAIFDAPAIPAPATTTVAAPPTPAEPPGTPAAPTAPAAEEVPYGLGEFSFERFFAGLEEDTPPNVPSPTPEQGRVPQALAGPPAQDPWPELSAVPPQDAGTKPSDDRTRTPDVAIPPVPAVSDDEDLAQFNAWLKGLLDP